MKVTKKEIEENKIFILKDVLSDIDKMSLWRMANEAPYRYGHKSELLTDEPQRRDTSHINIDKTSLNGRSFLLWTKKITDVFEEPLELNKTYINKADCATKTRAHCDNSDNGPSVLIPMNREWDRNWGGYTVFFKGMDSSEIVKTISPSPGQIIIFNGSMWHLALPPSMCAPGPRFMMALKFEYTNPEVKL